MSYWTMYWITRLDAIGVASTVLVVLAGMVMVGFCSAWLVTLDSYSEDDHEAIINAWRSSGKYIILVFFASILTLIATPTTKQAVAIWAVPKVVNNEQVQQIPDNALNLVNAKLKEWVDEVGPKTKKEAD